MDKRLKKLAKEAKKRTAKSKIYVTRLVNELKELAKGKTPPEVVDAQVDYYFKCSYFKQQILIAIFRRNEDKQLTEIAEYFSEVV